MSQRGFTIVEVTAVALIAAIMLSFTIPGILTYRASLRRVQATEQLVEDLRFARQMAVTQRAPVIVAFGNGSTTTDLTSYTIHVDTNNDWIAQASEAKRTRTLPPQTRLSRVNLSPTDTVVFDISGILWPSHNGGLLVVAEANVRETLQVAPTGMVYRQ